MSESAPITSPATASSTLWEVVERRAEMSPEVNALVQIAPEEQHDRDITFGGLRSRAEAVAAGLYELGVRPGSRVVWQLPTRIETVIVALALARLGAVQSPVIPVYRDREVDHVLRELKAEFFLVPGEFKGFDHREMAERLCVELDPAPVVFTTYDELPTGDPAVLPPAPRGADEHRWIYWTSGTTSTPKGVLHTDSTLIAAGAFLGDAMQVTPDDVGSMAFPFAHIAGPDYLIMQLIVGFPSVMFENFAMPQALSGYRRGGVTIAGGSTAFYLMFLDEQRKHTEVKLLPKLRLLAGGGAAKPPEVYHAVVRELGCQLTHGYGMTEAPMITMNSPQDTVENLAGTEGKPPSGMEIRIVDRDDRQLPAGTEGEVRLRGEAVCRGYLDPKQNDEGFDAHGFLITGDLGYLTTTGHLVLTGRSKDIIIRKGENISAKEIEDLLHQHREVGDVAVIGLPDASRGELVCAVVEQPAGAGQLSLQDVVGFLRDKGLPTYKLPERLEVLDRLPRNETLKKVLKFDLRRMLTPE